MASVGLLYVGAVLFINALLLLDHVEAKAAAILNLFVGLLQVVIPTILIVRAGDDITAISAAAGIYLFGFTYLYVGIGLLAGLDTTGVGWFSLFVSIAAIAFSIINFAQAHDYPFGVIWLMWSFLWFLFFVTLGLKREAFTRYTGWVTLVEAWVTAVAPAFLLLTGYYKTSASWAIGLAVFAVVVFLLLWVVAGPGRARSTAATESPTGP
jgi:hypothetical protein